MTERPTNGDARGDGREAAEAATESREERGKGPSRAELMRTLDKLETALEDVPPDTDDAWVDGVRLVERKLRGVLESEGVTPIEAAGQPFDPNFHEAVVHEETADYPDNHVIDELQRGYLLHDRVLRPALVRVANNPKEH